MPTHGCSFQPRADRAGAQPLVGCVVLALGLTWAVEIPLALSAQGVFRFRLPFALYYLHAYGPMLAALIVTWATEGRPGLRDLFDRMGRWRVGWGWAFASVFSPLALFAAAMLIARAAGAAWPDLWALGQMNFMPYLGIGAWALWILTSGFGEETGWRRYMLPHLQAHRSALGATLILWPFRVLWHVPAFFYVPTYVRMRIAGLPMIALGILAGAIVWTWLYNSTRGSILMLALNHGGFNFVTASGQGPPVVGALTSAFVMVAAVLIVVLAKPATLSGAARQTR